MKGFSRYFDQVFAANSVEQWLLAAGAATGLFLIALLVRGVALRQQNKFARTEAREALEWPVLALSRTASLFVVALSLCVGALMLETPDRVRTLTLGILKIAVFWQAGVWVSTLAMAWLDEKRDRSLRENRAAVGTLSIIALTARMAIWSVVLLLTLSNIGVDITALVAGLGVGGIAVALAVQNILGDLLASLSIALDKPFVVGDFLSVGEYLGSVEYIGVKSTRLRSLSGEQIIMSNADLLGARVRNYGRMQERRVLFTIGVTYETPRAKVESIPEWIREIVCSQPGVRFDRCHFAKFAAASLDFETVYYVLSSDYNRYMDIQQQINFRILEAFERRAVEFAYPTQKIWLANAAT